MNISYLYNCDETIFEVIIKKEVNGINFDTLFINPLCRFISNKEDLELLDSSLNEYIKTITSVSVYENDNSSLIENQTYFLAGTLDGGDNTISFAYSEEFTINSDDFNLIQSSSINLSKIITSVLNKNQENIKENLELEMEKMIKFNYSSLDEGVAEIFSLILVPGEDNIPEFSARYYGDPENQKNNDADIIENMFDKLVPVIITNLNTSNFFILREPIVTIKLGLSTSGEYIVTTNDSLLSNLSEEQVNIVQDILVKTYETL